MTITSNIHYNLTAWAASTAYSVGNRRSRTGVAYQCITAGTSASSGGPTGTSSDITDGTVHWKWLSAIDYTSLASWASGVTGTISQPLVALLWNNGVITTTTGTPFLNMTGNHGATATNTITIKCAPGESFVDTLASSGGALAYNTANGVSFQLPSSASLTNYIYTEDKYVTIQGIQIKDPIAASSACMVYFGFGADFSIVTDCIFDFFSGANVNAGNNSGKVIVTNCLFVDRNTSTSGGQVWNTYLANNVKIVNCSFVAVNGSVPADVYYVDTGTGCTVSNCIITGYSAPFRTANAAVIAVDHSVLSVSSVGANASNGTGNLFSKTAANQYVSATADFRLKQGADAVDTGVTDTTNVTTIDDILGTKRPQNGVWDIGCFELVVFKATSNIHVGLAAWQATHAYSLNNRVSKSFNAYQVTTAGTSGTTGPSGTGSTITDGGVTWRWLSAIDYTVLLNWGNDIPSTLTVPVTGLLWNNGTITVSSGTYFLNLANHTTSSTNTITLKCAPGESFTDTLAGQSVALTFSTTAGVSFTMPNPASSLDYFLIDANVTNVIFDGLQFLGNSGMTGADVIGVVAGGQLEVKNCIFDVNSVGTTIPLYCGGTLNMSNCFVIDRGSSLYATIFLVGSGSNITNSTFVSTTSQTYPVDVSANNPMNNSCFFGYGSTPLGGSANLFTVTNCGFSNASFNTTGPTDGGNNKFSLVASNQFVSSTTDFRLKLGSDLIDAGATDTTHIPTSTDIAGTPRIYGSAWDIGAWELIFSSKPFIIIAD